MLSSTGRRYPPQRESSSARKWLKSGLGKRELRCEHQWSTVPVSTCISESLNASGECEMVTKSPLVDIGVGNRLGYGGEVRPGAVMLHMFFIDQIKFPSCSRRGDEEKIIPVPRLRLVLRFFCFAGRSMVVLQCFLAFLCILVLLSFQIKITYVGRGIFVKLLPPETCDTPAGPTPPVGDSFWSWLFQARRCSRKTRPWWSSQ